MPIGMHRTTGLSCNQESYGACIAMTFLYVDLLASVVRWVVTIKDHGVRALLWITFATFQACWLWSLVLSHTHDMIICALKRRGFLSPVLLKNFLHHSLFHFSLLGNAYLHLLPDLCSSDDMQKKFIILRCPFIVLASKAFSFLFFYSQDECHDILLSFEFTDSSPSLRTHKLSQFVDKLSHSARRSTYFITFTKCHTLWWSQSSALCDGHGL